MEKILKERPKKAAGRVRTLFYRVFDAFFDPVFDAIFPKSALARELEMLTPETFEQKVPYAPTALSADTCALFHYRNRYMREAIWQIKYKGNRAVARLLAHFLADFLAKFPAGRLENNSEEILLIPLPLSPARRRERGYNQIELVLDQMTKEQMPKKEKLSKNIRIRTGILIKQKHTAPQSVIADRATRLRNLAGCFRVVDTAAVADRSIILLDDVITTGTTFAEARKTLPASGAQKVIALALAH